MRNFQIVFSISDITTLTRQKKPGIKRVVFPKKIIYEHATTKAKLTSITLKISGRRRAGAQKRDGRRYLEADFDLGEGGGGYGQRREGKQ